MNPIILARRTFTLEDQLHFASLSGDRNPIHLDPLIARRSLAGRPLVHGIHLLLWSLDTVVGQYGDMHPISAIRVSFEKMVTVGTPAEAVLVDRKRERIRIHVRAEGRDAAIIILTLGQQAPEQRSFRHEILFEVDEPLDLSTAAMESIAGKVAPSVDMSAICEAFPNLASLFGTDDVAGLMAATFLVGMVCPGLHSIFRSLDLKRNSADECEAALHFETVSFDERFHLVRLSVSGYGWAGKIDAHVRPEMVRQPAMNDAASLVEAQEFSGIRAVVIGGSRGLGESLAKLLAAGSAEVCISYRAGEADARRIKDEIETWGGKCDILRYDADLDPLEAFESFSGEARHLYYMATPPIQAGLGQLYSAARFEEYFQSYVRSFERTVVEAAKYGNGNLSVFYPSTVYVSEPPRGFVEYAMAKAAGEALCRGMVASGLANHVVIRRLPRLETDQTKSLIAEAFPDALPYLVAAAREMRGRNG